MASFQINFKGAGIVMPFEYICLECGHKQTIEQRRSDPMDVHDCEECGTKLVRHITAAPSLDADFHESQKSHNLNWE